MKCIKALPLALFCASTAAAQGSQTRPDSTKKLDAVQITATRAPAASVVQRATLPATATVTAEHARETVNLIDTEDAVKYLPSVFLRKRNNGDTQATMATRVWGVSSSARSLVFADGVPLTALIANNNTIGGPRWGLVAPVEIARIDMMYGPFSAAYAGNSMGAVMEITTRLPEHREVSVDQTHAMQTFDLYGTNKTFSTAQTSVSVGDRFGKFALWLTGNYQDSHSQPLTYVTSATFPNGTTGGYAANNKLGAAANVIGATGLLHTTMTNARVKAAYDFVPGIRASYTFAYWKNDASSGVDSYAAKSGAETFAGLAGFATGNYELRQEHSAHSLTLRTDRKRDWDFDAAVSRYAFGTDRQRFPTAATAADTFSSSGRIAILDGTRWMNGDLKAVWHRGGLAAAHVVSTGVHADRYRLFNPTFNTPNWQSANAYSSVATEGDGKTETRALWAQDAWHLSPAFTLTLGGRFEHWRAFGGFNQNGTAVVFQPTVRASRFSPKAALAWTDGAWSVTASLGRAYRFPTAGELYQLISTGSTFTSPDPDLKPDNVLATELRATRASSRSQVAVSLFNDNIHDAIISQFLPLAPGSSTLYSYISNVDHVRARGVELSATVRDALVRGLEFTASGTYVDARTLALSGAANATGNPDAAIGKALPNIPARRATLVTTYRASPSLALTFAARYSSKLYTTLDNADVNPNTYQGFSEWAVADARANYRLHDRWTIGFGVDNLFNRKYFLFHPFPQRTFVGNVRFELK